MAVDDHDVILVFGQLCADDIVEVSKKDIGAQVGKVARHEDRYGTGLLGLQTLCLAVEHEAILFSEPTDLFLAFFGDQGAVIHDP